MDEGECDVTLPYLRETDWREDPGPFSIATEEGVPAWSRRSAAYKLFLTRLGQARMNAGLTQVDVVKKVRRPQSYVSKCESGERRVDVVELVEFVRLYGTELTCFAG